MAEIPGGAADGKKGIPAEDNHTLSSRAVLLFSLTSALAVGNVYMVQPLLEAIAKSLHVAPGSLGSVVAITQTGYALGLLLLVPLGDRCDRKKLVIIQLLLSAVALTVAALATRFIMLLCALLLVGVMAVVAQVIVAWAATAAAPSQRGRVVGSITSGIVLGILLARVASGMIADISGWRAVYFTAAGLLLMLTVTLAVLIPAPGLPRLRASYLSLVQSMFALFITDSRLRQRGIMTFLIFTAFSLMWTSMVLPLAALSASLTQTGLFGLAGVAGALAASRAGVWADRGKGAHISAIALLLLTLCWLPLAGLERSWWLLLAGIMMLDFAVQAVHVINQSAILAARPETASRLVGANMCFYSLGSALGAITATHLYAIWGWYAVCCAGAMISVCALLYGIKVYQQ